MPISSESSSDEPSSSDSPSGEAAAPSSGHETPASKPSSGEAAPEIAAAKQHTATDKPASFTDFALDARIVEAVTTLGFDAPTAVQARAIPTLLEGRDMIGRARTGSGKTAAFGLPLLERVKDGGAARALVLTPTRELALQVGDALRSFAKRIKGLRIVTVYGGAPYPPQLKALRSGASVVVGTPGRVIDHLERGSLDLSALEVFVLDEADEMLRMGFIDDVERLLQATPATRQVALFSATMPEAIRRVAHTHLRDPIELQVESRALTVEHIEQHWIRVPERFKTDALVRLLRGVAHDTTLVFARTRAGCAELADTVAKRGVAVEALHGDLSQAARERVVQGLRARRLRVVIATDVAARGIDVDHITHVINLDLPPDAESYVHRIGRTARAGRAGTAISFVTPRAIGRIKRLQRALGVPIERMDVPSDADIARQQRARLKASLHEIATTGSLDGAQRLLQEATDESDHSFETMAAAALQLLARKERLSLRDIPAEGRPAWADPPPKRNRKPVRGERPERDRPPRREGPDETQQAQLLFPLGFSRGVRPADLVGLIANETGLPASSIGRIHITAHKSFVGVSHEVAQHVLTTLGKVNLRGVMVRASLARPRGALHDREHQETEAGKPMRSRKPPRATPARASKSTPFPKSRSRKPRKAYRADDQPPRHKPSRTRKRAHDDEAGTTTKQRPNRSTERRPKPPRGPKPSRPQKPKRARKAHNKPKRHR